jgi:hypothetical protein
MTFALPQLGQLTSALARPVKVHRHLEALLTTLAPELVSRHGSPGLPITLARAGLDRACPEILVIVGRMATETNRVTDTDRHLPSGPHASRPGFSALPPSACTNARGSSLSSPAPCRTPTRSPTLKVVMRLPMSAKRPDILRAPRGVRRLSEKEAVVGRSLANHPHGR